jgi:hypothetical protein
MCSSSSVALRHSFGRLGYPGDAGFQAFFGHFISAARNLFSHLGRRRENPILATINSPDGYIIRIPIDLRQEERGANMFVVAPIAVQWRSFVDPRHAIAFESVQAAALTARDARPHFCNQWVI